MRYSIFATLSYLEQTRCVLHALGCPAAADSNNQIVNSLEFCCCLSILCGIWWWVQSHFNPLIHFAASNELPFPSLRSLHLRWRNPIMLCAAVMWIASSVFEMEMNDAIRTETVLFAQFNCVLIKPEVNSSARDSPTSRFIYPLWRECAFRSTQFSITTHARVRLRHSGNSPISLLVFSLRPPPRNSIH